MYVFIKYISKSILLYYICFEDFSNFFIKYNLYLKRQYVTFSESIIVQRTNVLKNKNKVYRYDTYFIVPNNRL